MKLDFRAGRDGRGRKTIVPTIGDKPLDNVVYTEVECELDCTFLTVRVAILDDAPPDKPGDEGDCL